MKSQLFILSEVDPILVYIAIGLAIGAYIFLALLAIYVAVLQRRIQDLKAEKETRPISNAFSNAYVEAMETKIPLDSRQAGDRNSAI